MPPLSYDPVLELHHPTMGMIGGQGFRLEIERVKIVVRLRWVLFPLILVRPNI